MTTRWARLVGLIACVAALGGCVSQEGVSFGKSPYINAHFAEYAALPPGAVPAETDDEESESERSSIESVIVIGRTSAYREISADEAAEEYEKYRKQYRKAWGVENEPAVSLESFTETIAGWTRIKIMGVPLLFAGYVKALVPKSVLDEVDFEPSATTILLQLSSDLVATKMNADGALEIVALLCKDELGTSECSDDYENGLYDAASGKELKSKLVFKDEKRGDRIDPATYRLIEPGE